MENMHFSNTFFEILVLIFIYCRCRHKLIFAKILHFVASEIILPRSVVKYSRIIHHMQVLDINGNYYILCYEYASYSLTFLKGVIKTFI
jgi:hypothetical protein